MRSSDDVHDDLTARGVPHRLVRLPSSSRTAQLAAEALGVGVAEVVKSLLFVLDDERPLLVLVTGDETVDATALARESGARDARMARAREVRDLTGYHPGAVPPCALATGLPVVADPGVFATEVVYCGGGTTATMLIIRSADLATVLEPRILPIARRGAENVYEATPAEGRPTDGERPAVKRGHQSDEVEIATMTETLAHTIGSAARLAILSREDLDRLDAAALEVLAGTGVAIPSVRARAALVAQGASADGVRVTLPPDLVRRLVDGAPARMTLGARAGAIIVTGERSLVTTDGCCVEIYDLETGQKRGTRADDVATISRVVDALPEVDFCWPAVSAQDRPAEVRGLHELYLAIANTGKHVQTVTVVEPELAKVAVRMALAVSGSEEKLRAEPPISALLGTVTPLGNDEGTLEAGLVFAEAGIPIGFVTMPMGGSTTPITMAGSLVVGIAEALSSVCAIQAVVPGAPVFICFIPSVMDLKSGDFTGGAPEDTIMAAAVGDVGRFYGLPTQCGVNSSGAKEPNWQSALDDATTTYLSLAAGVDMLTGVGMVSGGRIFSYEEMALGVESLTHARAIAAGVDLTAAAGSAGGPTPPAAGPSLTVGLSHRHWTGSGRETAHDRAHERVASAVAGHRPPALDPVVDAELRRLAGIG